MKDVHLSGWSPTDGTSAQSRRADLQVKSAEINFLIRDPSRNNHKVVLMRLSVITSLLLKNVFSRWAFVCWGVEEVWRRGVNEKREEGKGKKGRFHPGTARMKATPTVGTTAEQLRRSVKPGMKGGKS